MEMNVDQSGRDDATFDVDDRGALGWKSGADSVNDALAHADVEESVAAARWIDQSAALEEKVRDLFDHVFPRTFK
jgi:hypothetical protein